VELDIWSDACNIYGMILALIAGTSWDGDLGDIFDEQAHRNRLALVFCPFKSPDVAYMKMFYLHTVHVSFTIVSALR